MKGNVIDPNINNIIIIFSLELPIKLVGDRLVEISDKVGRQEDSSRDKQEGARHMRLIYGPRA